MFVYVDDYYVLGTSKELIENFAMSLRRPDKKAKSKIEQHDDGFDFTVEDSIKKFLGVETHGSQGKVSMRQLYLIDRIVDSVGLASNQVEAKSALSTHSLYKD